MSDQEAGRPAKRAKGTDAGDGGGGGSISFAPSARASLPSLLVQLNGGRALDLSVLAAIAAANKGDDPSSADDNPHDETLQSTVDALFATHAGKSPQAVIGNAIRCIQDEVAIEADAFEKSQSNHFDSGGGRRKWFDHPYRYGIKGPRPDGKVWLALFLGEERAGQLLEGTAPIQEGKADVDATEAVIWRSLEKEGLALPPVDLLSNILSYVRTEAGKLSLKDLLRFSVLYGIDGVMKDILRGGYGDAGDLNANTLLPLSMKPLSPRMDLDNDRRLYVPLYAFGAILGHANVAVTALSELGGEMDAPYGAQFKVDEEVKTFDDQHNLPSVVFGWIFHKNMPDMIKCLVNECGFQFRWIDHENELPKVLERIFEASEYEDYPRWAGELDREDLMWESSRERCRLRSKSAYKVQMKMLDLLISLGLPFDLIFPVDLQPQLEIQEKLRKEKKLETNEQCREYDKRLGSDIRKAMSDAYSACSAYNSLQSTEPETLTLGDFFRKMKSRWEEGQKSVQVQVSRLDEFEALDSRWRKTTREQQSESDADY